MTPAQIADLEEAAARRALEAAAKKARKTMIAEMAGLNMENPYRAGIKWCGEAIQETIAFIDPAQFRSDRTEDRTE